MVNRGPHSNHHGILRLSPRLTMVNVMAMTAVYHGNPYGIGWQMHQQLPRHPMKKPRGEHHRNPHDMPWKTPRHAVAYCVPWGIPWKMPWHAETHVVGVTVACRGIGSPLLLCRRRYPGYYAVAWHTTWIMPWHAEVAAVNVSWRAVEVDGLLPRHAMGFHGMPWHAMAGRGRTTECHGWYDVMPRHTAKNTNREYTTVK